MAENCTINGEKPAEYGGKKKMRINLRRIENSFRERTTAMAAAVISAR